MEDRFGFPIFATLISLQYSDLRTRKCMGLLEFILPIDSLGKLDDVFVQIFLRAKIWFLYTKHNQPTQRHIAIYTLSRENISMILRTVMVFQILAFFL